jgi:hypothetical protein
VQADHASLTLEAWRFVVGCVLAYVLMFHNMKGIAIEALQSLLYAGFLPEEADFGATGARKMQALSSLRAQLATWLLQRSRSDEAVMYLDHTLEAGGLTEVELTPALICLRYTEGQGSGKAILDRRGHFGPRVMRCGHLGCASREIILWGEGTVTSQ